MKCTHDRSLKRRSPCGTVYCTECKRIRNGTGERIVSGRRGNQPVSLVHEIAMACEIHDTDAQRLYEQTLREIQKSGPTLETLHELTGYHMQLRAGSVECLAAQGRWLYSLAQ